MTDEDSPPVDDNSPETGCQPNLYGFCRYCGRDMKQTAEAGAGPR